MLVLGRCSKEIVQIELQWRMILLTHLEVTSHVFPYPRADFYILKHSGVAILVRLYVQNNLKY